MGFSRYPAIPSRHAAFWDPMSPWVPIFAPGHVGDVFGLHHPTSNLESQLFVAHPIFHPMGHLSNKNWLVVFRHPPEKYESQIGSSSQLLGKIKHVPNHQPGKVVGKTMTSPTFSKPREPPLCWLPFSVAAFNDSRLLGQVYQHLLIQGSHWGVHVLRQLLPDLLHDIGLRHQRFAVNLGQPTMAEMKFPP